MKWWNRSNSQADIETQEASFRQWSVRIERKAFRRNITIALKPNSPIIVRANRKTPWSTIEKFLETKEKWIAKHLQGFIDDQEKFPAKTLKHDETFPFLGENLPLAFVPTPLKRIFFSRNEKNLVMHIPEALWNGVTEEELQEHFPKLQQFYQREAEKLILERAKFWSEQMKLTPASIRFRNQKTRWGSCSSRKVINFNWRLIGAPLEVVDYIIVHEFAHLRHMNHSEQFWNLVEAHISDFQTSEKWLKDHGQSLDFLGPNASA